MKKRIFRSLIPPLLFMSFSTRFYEIRSKEIQFSDIYHIMNSLALKILQRQNSDTLEYCKQKIREFKLRDFEYHIFFIFISTFLSHSKPVQSVFLFFGCSMQDLSSLTRDLTHAPLHWECSCNHWTVREISCLPCL